MWAEREEHGGTLPEPILWCPSAHRRRRNSLSPHPVSPPGELDDHRPPRSPVGGVVSGRSFEPLAGELVAEVINDEPELVCVDCEGLDRFGAGEGGRGGGEAVHKWTAEAPPEKLVAEEATGLDGACG